MVGKAAWALASLASHGPWQAWKSSLGLANPIQSNPWHQNRLVTPSIKLEGGGGDWYGPLPLTKLEGGGVRVRMIGKAPWALAILFAAPT